MRVVFCVVLVGALMLSSVSLRAQTIPEFCSGRNTVDRHNCEERRARIEAKSLPYDKVICAADRCIQRLRSSGSSSFSGSGYEVQFTTPQEESDDPVFKEIIIDPTGRRTVFFSYSQSDDERHHESGPLTKAETYIAGRDLILVVPKSVTAASDRHASTVAGTSTPTLPQIHFAGEHPRRSRPSRTYY